MDDPAVVCGLVGPDLALAIDDGEAQARMSEQHLPRNRQPDDARANYHEVRRARCHALIMR